jgi:hypothetical protein
MRCALRLVGGRFLCIAKRISVDVSGARRSSSGRADPRSRSFEATIR